MLRRFSEAFLGRYRSSFHGQGIEFADLRTYAPGDDARTIDWRATARTGHTLVRTYEEERGRRTIFLVDVGMDMILGSHDHRPKSATRDEALSLLMHASAQSRDRIGSVFFAEDVLHALPTQGGLAHIARIEHTLSETTNQSHGRSTIVPVLDLLTRTRTRDALIFVLTDSMDTIDPIRLAGLARTNALIWLHIADRAEDDPMELSRIRVQEADTVGYYALRGDPRADSYRARRQEAWELGRSIIEGAGGYLCRLDDTHDVYQTLVGFFERLHRR